MPALSYADSWTATLHGVYYTQSSDDPRVVHFYDFATRQSRPIAHLSQPPTPFGGLGISVSTDERYLLYTQTEEHQSDVMLLKYQQ